MSILAIRASDGLVGVLLAASLFIQEDVKHPAFSSTQATADQEPAVPLADAATLFRMGDEAAREKRYVDALDLWRQAYLLKLPMERDLHFREQVAAEYMDREALRRHLVEDLAKEYPDEQIEADELAYRHFGFVEPDFDLKKDMTNLLTEEIGGFYDPKAKKLYLIKEVAGPAEDTKETFWTKLFGGGDDFDPDDQKAVLAHEMDHALVDQHFDLEALQSATEADDDMSLAVSAIGEGDATLLMIVDAAGPRGRSFLETPPDFLSGFMDVMMSSLAPYGSGESFRRSPLLLRESLLFPYMKGMRFCLSLTQDGTWDAVNRAFKDPPASTEQILHPEKYRWATRDEPVALRFDVAAPLPSDQWRLVKENILGEFQIEVLLRPELGRSKSAAAAAGWDGDTYRLYRREGSAPAQTLLVWASTWDSEKEAREIADALLAVFAEDEAAESPISGLEPAERIWAADGTLSSVWRRGSDVWFLSRVPRADFAKLATWSLKLAREPKRVVLKNATATPGK